MANVNSWRTNDFRQMVVGRIEEAIRRSGRAYYETSNEAEASIFYEAVNKKEYLNKVNQLISIVIPGAASNEVHSSPDNVVSTSSMQPSFSSQKLVCSEGYLDSLPAYRRNFLTRPEIEAHQRRLSKYLGPLEQEIGKGNVYDVETMRELVFIHDLLSKPQLNVAWDTFMKYETRLKEAFDEKESQMENEDFDNERSNDASSSSDGELSEDDGSRVNKSCALGTISAFVAKKIIQVINRSVLDMHRNSQAARTPEYADIRVKAEMYNPNPAARESEPNFTNNEAPSTSQVCHKLNDFNRSSPIPIYDTMNVANEELAPIHNTTSNVVNEEPSPDATLNADNEEPTVTEARVPPLRISRVSRTIRRNRDVYSAEQYRKMYFRKKLEIARFEMSSKRRLHKLEYAIKKRQLEMITV